MLFTPPNVLFPRPNVLFPHPNVLFPRPNVLLPRPKMLHLFIMVGGGANMYISEKGEGGRREWCPPSPVDPLLRVSTAHMTIFE